MIIDVELAELCDFWCLSLFIRVVVADSWNKEKFVTAYFEDPDRLLQKNGLQYMAEDGKDASKCAFSRDEGDIARQTTMALPTASQMDRSKTAPPSASSANDNQLSYNSSFSSSSLASASTSSSHSASATVNCPVCYDDYPLDATVALGCGHRWVSTLELTRTDSKPTRSSSAHILMLVVVRIQVLSRLLVRVSIDGGEWWQALHQHSMCGIQVSDSRAGSDIQESHTVSRR
jgi:hypothetical protein